MSGLEHLFEKIATGEIPSYKIYEDEAVFVFLDINPGSRGHTLVIPKQRYVFVHELPSELGAAIGRVLPGIAKAVMSAVGATDYNILCNNGGAAGQVVPHVHFHIIPKFAQGEAGGVGLSARWDAEGIDAGDAEALVAGIRAELCLIDGWHVIS